MVSWTVNIPSFMFSTLIDTMILFDIPLVLFVFLDIENNPEQCFDMSPCLSFKNDPYYVQTVDAATLATFRFTKWAERQSFFLIRSKDLETGDGSSAGGALVVSVNLVWFIILIAEFGKRDDVVRIKNIFLRFLGATRYPLRTNLTEIRVLLISIYCLVTKNLKH